MMIADGQWTVRTKTAAAHVQENAVQGRLADGRRVEMTVEELARAVGAADPGAHSDQATD
ncbi:hypothetical protein [Kitasatospora sp. RG8]|uniref:hypothetical protein n=1 Tax=Kitasatospora sp. RG8 TaxID=2820815 RepID=UPI001FD780C3|nr:hypothetical protein [Kitasatospora sp. RG8]